ncbi:MULTISPECIES: DUF5694 domain-containing protein [Flavobacteriaceae]|uniref:DUF5694 domain-containing protein n=1 Tax=Flavobacteriaceae TaxID=49546 RepID=UPI0014912491|nr:MULTISPECIES: DUF5694 domain-containing protein [Allomuricauda]MDC6365564.1 DUF5694 domain-containing protein [Muricauda sp. AC10]
MNQFSNSILLLFILLAVLNCKPNKSQPLSISEIEKAEVLLKNHDSLAQSKIMIVGTFHFNREVLEEESQENISKLVKALSEFNPTKVVIEWEPSLSKKTNNEYHSYLKDSFDISTLENEIYQLGFRIAKEAKNDSIYLFDNQTEYIGSLENFSFDSFAKYANENDGGFYNKHEKDLIETYNHNQEVFNNLNIYDQIALRNSQIAQKINEQRMHMYEIRVGIQKNWIGPDWLGRWYQRNIRMVGNILKMNQKGDRILVIVGDNHKWTLDMLLENIPDFEVVSSWDYLKKSH